MKGLVNRFQIGRKCIQLEFDESKVLQWINTILGTDQKYDDFSWENTATRVDKKNQKIREQEYKKEKQRKYHEAKKKAAEKEAEKQKKFEEKQARKAEIAAKKEEEKAAAEAAKEATPIEDDGEDAEEDSPEQFKVGAKVYRQKEKKDDEPEEAKEQPAATEVLEAEAPADDEYGEYGEYYDEEYEEEVDDEKP